MDSDLTVPAEGLLRKEAESLQRRAKELLDMADRLANGRKSETEVHNVRPVIPNEYRGKTAVQALEAYMRARQGVKIPLSRIVQDLIAGGVESGRSRGKRTGPADLIEQNIKIALAKSYRLYEVEPKGSLRDILAPDILISLAPSAHTVKLRTQKPKKNS